MGANQDAQSFYHLGENVFIETGFEISCPPLASIGELTYIQKDCFFNIPNEQDAGFPRIEIRENCSIGKRCVLSAVNRIVIEDRALIGANVHISDHDHAYQEVGVPIMFQGATSLNQTVTVGRGSWIANNCVIVGDVHIGRGCVVGANSVVCGDIPDYCVAVGSPARVIKCFDVESGAWKRIGGQHELEQILQARRERPPILSVCLIAGENPDVFRSSMAVVCKDAGNDPMLEIVMCDSGKSPGVSGLARQFCAAFQNVRLVDGAPADGVDKRYLFALNQAKGEFASVVEDVHCFAHNGVYHILHSLFQNRNCKVLLARPANQMISCTHGSGWEAYRSLLHGQSTEPYRVVFQTEAVKELPDPSRYIGTGWNHIYLQHACLCAGERYGVADGIVFMGDHVVCDTLDEDVRCGEFIEKLSSAGLPDSQCRP